MRKFASLLMLPGMLLAIYDIGWIDVNNWRMPVCNDGRWAIDVTHSNFPGGSWPYPLMNFYLFGGGLWVGAIMQGETLVTCGYNPNSGGGEMAPTLCRYWRDGYNDPRDRIYRFPGDWPPPQSRFPMAPVVPRSDLNLWCCFGDSDPANHYVPGHPLGIDVALTTYAFADSEYRDIILLRYDVFNNNDHAINQCYIALCLDADIGHATDDMNGLILDKLFQRGPDTFRVRNTGFTGDYDNHEQVSDRWQGGTPGVAAVRLLSAPGGLDLSAFKTSTLDTGSATDRDQYLTMAGYDYRTGIYSPFDSADESAADKRFLLSCGPFDFAARDSATFWYAIVAAQFGPENEIWPHSDTSELAWRCHLAEQAFERLPGVTEEPSRGTRTPNPMPSHVRGVLELAVDSRQHTACRAELLDISGRKVLNLHPGPNDVSGLAPGVYFIQRGRPRNQSVERIVLAR